MNDFIQLLLSGLASGSIYALAALGFTLLWQASGTINFAQGEFVMLPAFMMLAFNSLGLPLLLSFAFTCFVAVIVLGWAFKRGVADPLLKFGMMPIVVATLGLSIAMKNGIRAGVSAEAFPFPSLFGDAVLATLYDNNPRAPRALRPEDIARIDLDRAIAIYRERFSSAKDLTFILVGSFDPVAIKPLLATWLGWPRPHLVQAVQPTTTGAL